MKSRLLLAWAASLAVAVAGGWYASRIVTGPPASASPSSSTASLSHASGPASAGHPAAPQPVQTVGGETVVAVSTDAQRASGMAVRPIAASTVQSERDAYATVVDPQPLFDLRARLASARADVATLETQAQNSDAQYRRSLALYNDDRNVSLKALQEARATMQADQAKLQSAKAALVGIVASLHEQFGDALASAALAPDSSLMSRLQSRDVSILRAALALSPDAVAPDRITVRASDGRPISAERLSPSPIADPVVQGTPWFYIAHASLPVGTRTIAAVPTSQTRTRALIVPADAVIWYGGQTWAYVRVAPNRFARRYVQSIAETDAGVAVTSGFHEGDMVVTHGAQLLLSEELKPQGIATACKDPPECDD